MPPFLHTHGKIQRKSEQENNRNLNLKRPVLVNISLHMDQYKVQSKRTIVVEPHILAYLGHYMRTFEESVKRKAMLQCTLAPSQSSQLNTASAHDRS
jgi:hypothetical protein